MKFALIAVVALASSLTAFANEEMNNTANTVNTAVVDANVNNGAVTGKVIVQKGKKAAKKGKKAHHPAPEATPTASPAAETTPAPAAPAAETTPAAGQ